MLYRPININMKYVLSIYLSTSLSQFSLEQHYLNFIISRPFLSFNYSRNSTGVASVVTMAAHLHDGDNGKNLTVDNVEICEAMKKLEAAGADVVGLNCANGPETILGYMELIRKSGVKVCCSMYKLYGNFMIVTTFGDVLLL